MSTFEATATVLPKQPKCVRTLFLVIFILRSNLLLHNIFQGSVLGLLLNFASKTFNIRKSPDLRIVISFVILKLFVYINNSFDEIKKSSGAQRKNHFLYQVLVTV